MIKKKNLDPSLVTYIDGAGNPFTHVANAECYYVNSNTGEGSDNWSGLSWDEAFATITHALAVAPAWSIIYVAGGD